MSEKINSTNLTTVIKINKEIHNEINQKVISFKANINTMQVTSAPQFALQLLKSHGLIQMPIDNQYLSGAIFIVGNKKVPFINTAQPRANQYFTAFHELYHLYFDEVSFNHLIETETTMEERKADHFASLMLLGNLLPYFNELSDSDFLSKVFQCMSTFQAPYKAVLIALYESAYQNNNQPIMNEVIHNFDRHFSDLASYFRELGLDDNLVTPSNIINVSSLQSAMLTAAKNEPEINHHHENLSFLKSIIDEIKLLAEMTHE